MTEDVLLSIGKGMRLYLCFAKVDLEGSPRRMLLCTYDINEMHDVEFK